MTPSSTCDIVGAGKMRNGRERWWCRTHQRHWGTKADIKDGLVNSVFRCADHSQPMSYVVDPVHIDIASHAEVGIWCSMPPAPHTQGPGARRRPKIHVHVRDVAGQTKVIDQDFKALSLVYNSDDDLFGSLEITKVHLTPPSALEFVLALESGNAMGCINCRDCGYPHLDLGDFARTAHSKHLCGNCGRDNTWMRRGNLRRVKLRVPELVLLFLLGAVASLVGDHSHVVTGTTEYFTDAVPFMWSSPIWFPAMVGAAIASLAELRLHLPDPRTNVTARQGLAGIAAVIGTYVTTALVHSAPTVPSTALIVAMAVITWCVLGDKSSVVCGVIAAIIGPIVEIRARQD